MIQALSGSIDVQVPAPDVEYGLKVTERIVNSLKAVVPSAIIESSSPLRYKRPALQFGFVGIASFGAGEIQIGQHHGIISIKYSLSMAPYYRQLSLVGFLCGLFAWKAFMSPVYVGILFIASELVILTRFMVSISSVRSWLRSLAVSAMNHSCA